MKIVLPWWMPHAYELAREQGFKGNMSDFVDELSGTLIKKNTKRSIDLIEITPLADFIHEKIYKLNNPIRKRVSSIPYHFKQGIISRIPLCCIINFLIDGVINEPPGRKRGIKVSRFGNYIPCFLHKNTANIKFFKKGDRST